MGRSECLCYDCQNYKNDDKHDMECTIIEDYRCFMFKVERGIGCNSCPLYLDEHYFCEHFNPIPEYKEDE